MAQCKAKVLGRLGEICVCVRSTETIGTQERSKEKEMTDKVAVHTVKSLFSSIPERAETPQVRLQKRLKYLSALSLFFCR